MNPDKKHGTAPPDLAQNTVLLETLRFDSRNRYSLLFSNPYTILSTYNLGDVPELLRELDHFTKRGWYAAGYVSYEAGYAFVPSLAALYNGLRPDLPLVWFGIYPKPYVWDPRIQHPPYAVSPFVLRNRLGDGIKRASMLVPAKRRMNGTRYRSKLIRVKDHIRQGNTYQINLTWNEVFEFQGSPFAFYHYTKHLQPVSYAAYITCGEARILSFSPELFFKLSGRRIVTRPMKGTIARGRDECHDKELRQILADSEKNRAENLMIVDLLRNDLGKIAEPGSVRVSELFNIESYPSLFQMTSTIEAVLKKHVTYTDIFKGLFPCGSVTGAPKISSMRIIRELEEENRGVYTGSIGYISPDAVAVFSVAIRTPVIYNQTAVMGVGSGIVWDSDPQDEYRECLLKMDFLKAKQQDFHIYESLLWDGGAYFLRDYHAQRMAAGAAYFSFSFDEDLYHKKLEENLNTLNNGSAYKVKILLDRKGLFTITNERIESTKQNGLRIALCGRHVSSSDPFLYHKTTKRDLYNKVLKKAQAKGFWDVTFCNERGEITEGCRSNIIIKEKGGLFTPPVSCGLLAGTMRRYLIEVEHSVTEDVISLPRLKAAEEIYMCNSVRKMVKVSLSDDLV